MRIVATFLDGSRHETDTALYQCLTDRFAFRERFGVSWLSVVHRLRGQDASAQVDTDERMPAFFDWRCLSRNGYRESFDTFLETVADVSHPELEALAEAPGDVETEKAEPEGTKEEEPDPTPSPGETTSMETTSGSHTSSEPSE